MFDKLKWKEWFDRYKYSELAATSVVVLGSQLIHFFEALATAYLITGAEYFAFYSVMFYRSYKDGIKTDSKHDFDSKEGTLAKVVLLVRQLFLEFGYPAGLDLVFVRPFCMYWGGILTGDYFIGIVFGKITADIFFYCCTILNYELIQRGFWR
jgi:hypothetical protein